MIEPAPLPQSTQTPPVVSDKPRDPLALEDLVAAVHLPRLHKKVRGILDRALTSFAPPEDLCVRLVSREPGDGRTGLGLSWRDAGSLLEMFAGLYWGDGRHDPVWEVRVQALPGLSAEKMRKSDLPRLAARRADGRVGDWGYFWHDDKEATFLLGTSAACTRFLEEEDPDGAAAEFLAAGLHALRASGALAGLVEAAASFSRS